MGDTTKIEWTDHTFNPWIGCTNISPGCDHCYAENLARKYGWHSWGAKEPRRRTSAGNWRKPVKWNRDAERARRRRRVFCASLADVFDNQVADEWRADLFDLIRATPWLDWQLLTKRPENLERFLPAGWSADEYPNVWLGVTAEDQPHYARRWPIVAGIDARIRFVSYEPAVGPLRLMVGPQPDWMIWGGESGNRARVMRPDWARRITADCELLGIPVFGKQWGTYRSNPVVAELGGTVAQARAGDPPSNGKGGALLDGRVWREFPRGREPVQQMSLAL